MLRKIKIKSYRSCRNLTIDNLGPMTVLAGRNGVGKTNILKAIHWAARSATSTEPLGSVKVGNYFDPASVELEFEVEDSSYKYLILQDYRLEQIDENGPEFPRIHLKEQISIKHRQEAWADGPSRDGPVVSVPGRDPLNIPLHTPLLTALVSVLPPDDEALLRIKPVIDFLGNVRYYPFDEPSEPTERDQVFEEEHYKQWLGVYKSDRRAGTSVLMRLLHMKLEAVEEFEELRSLLGRDGLGLIDDISIVAHDIRYARGPNPDDLTVRKFYFVTFLPCQSPPENSGPNSQGFNFNDLSMGTRRIIRILISLIFDKSSVMLIEHPEDGVHRKLTSKLIGVLRSYGDSSQLLISSHSLVVFDELQPEQVRLVSMRNGETSVRSLDKDELRAAHKYMSEDGPLSSYLHISTQD